MGAEQEITIGIDLGTSNSCVAAVVNGKPRVIIDQDGNHVQPSVVSFGNDNKILVGRDAKEQMIRNPKRTVFSVKRLIGRKMFSAEVKKARQLYPYEIVDGDNKEIRIKIGEDSYSPAEISALILKKMKRLAEEALQTEIKKGVVTVPAYFNDNQRQATRDACLIAGLEPLRIINEPTAATLAYGYENRENAKVAVYDLGGGTFDLSILELSNSVFEVIATAGDTYLGGDDFDDRLIDYFAEQFQKQHQIDLRSIPQALQKLRHHSEQAKIRLSYEDHVDVIIPQIISDSETPIDFRTSISRQAFINLTYDLIQRTFKVCDEAFQDAGFKPAELDRLIFVGGSTKMPIITETCRTYFGREPYKAINPDDVIAMGAAIQADSLVKDNTVAKPMDKKTLLLDVTPLTLSVGTVGGLVEPIIEKNTPIPTEKNKLFMTNSDNQETVRVQIFQGRSRNAAENELLGEFEFSGFRKALRGEIIVDIKFEIDTDGIVNVSATDKETGKQQTTKVYLATAYNSTMLDELKEKVTKIKEVQLKKQLPATTRVERFLIETKDDTRFQACVLNFLIDAPKFTFLSEGDLYKADSKPQTIDRSRVRWMLRVDDFTNISRYLPLFETSTEHPTTGVAVGNTRTFFGIQQPTTVPAVTVLACSSTKHEVPMLFIFEGRAAQQNQETA